MSLFVAVRPSTEAVEHLDDALASLRRDSRAASVRWQPPHQWHITLCFLGQPDEDTAFEVAERLDELATATAVAEVRLAGSGAFGPEVLWIGVDAPAGLAAIARSIPGLLRGSGAVVDRREWRAHLTIGRAHRGDVRPVADLLASYRGPAWTADAVHLVRSTGGPRPEHRIVHSVLLAAAR